MRWRGLILALCLVLALSSFADAVKIVQPAGGGAPTGPAGGDLGGSYPNPTVTSGAHIGAGTLPNNALSGWPLTFFAVQPGPGGANNSLANTANKINIFSGFYIPAPVTWTHICYYGQTADAAGNYDLGIANSAGTILADTGAIHIAAAKTCPVIIQNASCTGSGAPATCCTGVGTGTCPVSVTTQPGIYRLVTTGTAITAKLFTDNANNLFANDGGTFSTGVTAGGVLPASITPPSTDPTASEVTAGVAIY